MISRGIKREPCFGMRKIEKLEILFRQTRVFNFEVNLILFLGGDLMGKVGKAGSALKFLQLPRV